MRLHSDSFLEPEILKLEIGMFPVTSFTSITGLLERAA